MAFLSTIWNWICTGVSLILPFGKGLSLRRLGPGLRWTLHFLLLGIILVGLFFLNRLFNIAQTIPTAQRWLAELWLPILFLLVYVLAWLGWWLWKLLMAEEASSFPDIDAAWDEAMRVLGENGLAITELPLFFVLGRPEGPDGAEKREKSRQAEEFLFHSAAQLQLAVKQTPASAIAPLHVYATRDAVYVTCAGASLLGRQVDILGGDVDSAPDGPMLGVGGPGEDPNDKTLRPDSASAPVREMVGIVRRIAKKGGEATEEERRLLRMLERRDRPQAALLKNSSLVEEYSARMRHLGRLIMRDRQPYCPINGILLLIPLASTDSDEDAQNTAELTRRDMANVRRTLKVNCPIFALVCDLEKTGGFREFIQRQDQRDRQRRLGQRFPLAADLDPAKLVEKVEGSVRWLCENVLRDWVYRLFRLESTGRDDFPTVTGSNGKLFHLLNEMRERSTRLGTILRNALTTEDGSPPIFGGCYVAGTGGDPGKEQAFVGGVFKRLTEAQSYIAWTDPALAEDARAHRWANIAYGILAGLGVAVIAVVGWTFFGPGSRGKKS